MVQNPKQRDVVKFLKKNKYKLVRTKGSHAIYKKKGSKYNLSVPIHRNVNGLLVKKLIKDMKRTE